MVSMVFYGFAMVSYGFLWVCKGFAIVMVLLWFCYGFYTFVKALVVFAIVLFWKDKTGKASKDISSMGRVRDPNPAKNPQGGRGTLASPNPQGGGGDDHGNNTPQNDKHFWIAAVSFWRSYPQAF